MHKPFRGCVGIIRDDAYEELLQDRCGAAGREAAEGGAEGWVEVHLYGFPSLHVFDEMLQSLCIFTLHLQPRDGDGPLAGMFESMVDAPHMLHLCPQKWARAVDDISPAPAHEPELKKSFDPRCRLVVELDREFQNGDQELHWKAVDGTT